MKLKNIGIPGIHIQWPWSQLLLNGKKVIETRSYPIPEKFVGMPLAVIETPGPTGKKNGIQTAIIGIITFDSAYQYSSREQWLRDEKLHLVPPNDKLYGFKSGKPKWAWKVSSFEKRKPSPPPKIRGIIYAKNCKVSQT